MSKELGQIPLDFKDSNIQTFENFIIGNNHAVIDGFKTFSISNESLFYLWGDSGTGKSHMLNAFIDKVTAINFSAVLITPEDISKRENISLIEMFDFICIDKVENIIADKYLEEILFFWINEIKQVNKKLILAGKISNNSKEWQLPDLRTRLTSGRTYQINHLDRENVLAVFNQLATQKGIVIDSIVNNYLKNNIPMKMSFLSDLLQKLDQITLIEKKQVTIPLVKKIINKTLLSN